MKKQIILEEGDCIELEQKAAMFDRGTIMIRFFFSGYGMDRSVNIYETSPSENMQTISHGTRLQIESFISDIERKVKEDVEMFRSEEYNLYQKPTLKKQVHDLEEELNKIPNWIKRIFL